MPTRPFFLAIVLAALAASACALATVPPHPIPAYALQAAVIYRGEIAVAAFGGMYVVLACVRLAWHGRTPTRIGATLEMPDVADRAGGEVASLHAAVRRLASVCTAIEDRLRALEGAPTEDMPLW
jgi:hypothetical protein